VTRNRPPANVFSSTLTRHAINRSVYHSDPNNSPEDRMVLRYVGRGLDKHTDVYAPCHDLMWSLSIHVRVST
jgi:hypothetical protein